MNLSDSITFIRKLAVFPVDSLLAQWQEQARKLEGRAAELQKMNDNQFAQLEANDKIIKELQQDENDYKRITENLNDKLRATKAELEGCRVAYKGKKEQVDGLYGQLRERDRLIVALRQEGEHLRRSISENANTVALNKHIANLTSENQRQKNTIRQLEDQNKNLEAALVKAEGQVRCLQGVVDIQTKLFHAVPTPGYDLATRLERQRRTIDDYRAEVDKLLRQLNELTDQRDRLAAELRDVRKALAAKTLDCNDAANKLAEKTQQYDTDITARNADVRWLSKEREELKDQLDKQAKVFLLRCDGLVDLTNKMERQINDLVQQRDSLKRCNDNQSGFIREYQEEVRKLREQLEAEKAKVGPVQDIYKDSKLEVRLLNDGEVQVLEYPANLAASPRRLRKTHALVDWRTKVAHREVSINDVDFKKGQVLGTITEYGPGRTLLSVFTGVPINGLLVTTGA